MEEEANKKIDRKIKRFRWFFYIIMFILAVPLLIIDLTERSIKSILK